MNEVRTLENLFKTDQSSAQAAPRKKAERGEFANQFLALLFDENSHQGSVSTEQGKGARNKATAGEKGADRSPDTDLSSSGKWVARFDLHHDFKVTERSKGKSSESESESLAPEPESDDEAVQESTDVHGTGSKRRPTHSRTLW